jgi:CheY-like chemotaxis protein
MSTRNILLVDDSRSARYALRLLLQKHGCEVDTAESAETALEKVKASLPDAIFMDHLMPGMNGFEALDVLKADSRTAHIPVVMCTSNDELPYQQQARKKGALGILPKPATPEKLSAVLAAIDTAIAAQPAPSVAAVAAEPEPAAPAVPTAPTLGTIVALVREELRRLMDHEVRPLVNDTLEHARTELANTLLNRASEQLAQRMDTEMGRLRQELAAASSGDSGSSAKLEGAMRQLRGELLQKEGEHTQALVQKITRDLLPDLIRQGVEQMEQRFSQRLEQRLGEQGNQLAEELSRQPQLVRRLSELAETAAEQKAAEIAQSNAREITESFLETRASEVADSLVRSGQSAMGRMYLLAGLAAAAGVLSSLAVYFLMR